MPSYWIYFSIWFLLFKYEILKQVQDDGVLVEDDGMLVEDDGMLRPNDGMLLQSDGNGHFLYRHSCRHAEFISVSGFAV
jgi:hypothetical protein